MRSIPEFDSEIYSEEIYPVSEQEFDEVMQATSADDFSGYARRQGIPQA